MPDRTMLMRDLEIALEKLKDFVNPVEKLEQYRTPGNIAALMIWEASLRRDLHRDIVVDLGCGTGVLTYGSLLLGASSALCLDIDWSALYVARENLVDFSGLFDLVAGDARNLPMRPISDKCTVIMNPPFGVKTRGADIEFLKAALGTCSTVYSLHKYSLESLKLISKVAEELGFALSVVTKATMVLKQRLRHHRKKTHRFEVALIRLVKTSECGGVGR
ncbi:MAG: METTL5 family protein [Sulfolobales archaeon]